MPSTNDTQKPSGSLSYTTVQLPELFQSFVKESPRINEHYAVVKTESEDWLHRLCSFSPKMQAKIRRCDFSYFCAIAAPDAPKERFRTLCDWGNWVFPYDDLFDNGALRDRPDESHLMMESLMAHMLGKQDYFDPPLPIIEAHNSVFDRMSVSGEDVRSRFAAAMQLYAQGAMMHVEDHSNGRVPDLVEMVLMRRESAGVSPIYHLVEYAHGLKVPKEVFQHKSIRELEVLGMDMVSITNDMLSYRKEEAEGVPHNMVAVCRMKGMNAQEAFDTVGDLLTECYRRWDEIESDLPSWGDPLTNQMTNEYIKAIKCVVTANAWWSFKSERYFGAAAEAVRSSGQIEVLHQPSYLNTVV